MSAAAPAREAAPAAAPADRRAPALFALGLVAVAAAGAGARARDAGLGQLALAAAVVVVASALAALLPLRRRLALLACAALVLRLALPVTAAADSMAYAGGLLRQLAYFAVPPLAVHLALSLRARGGLSDFGLSALALYAPMPVAFLAQAVYDAMSRQAWGGAGVARVFYGALYALLLGALLLRDLRAPSRPAPVLAERAAQAEQQGRFGLAQRYYAQTERLDKAAEMAERAGEWARAAELFRRAGDVFRAAEMAFRAERFDDALTLYEQAGEHAAAARTAERLGRVEHAAALYERAGDAAAAVRVLEGAGRRPRGDLYARAERLEDAVVAWQEEGRHEQAAEALVHDFDDLEGAAQVYANAGLQRRAGELFERAGRAEAAIAAYLAAPDAQVEAARLCVETGDVERAGRIVAALPEEAVAALDDEATLLMLARVEERAGRSEPALRLLQKLRRRAEPPPGVFLPLGRCLLARGLVELAEENLRTALELALDEAEASEAAYLLGTVLEERGAHAEAAQVYLDLMRKDLGYRDVEARYRRLTGAA